MKVETDGEDMGNPLMVDDEEDCNRFHPIPLVPNDLTKQVTGPFNPDAIDNSTADGQWMKSARCSREKILQHAEVLMTWMGCRNDYVVMMEINGNDDWVIPIPIQMAFRVNEFACVIMCFGHAQFVEYCLMDMKDEELVH